MENTVSTVRLLLRFVPAAIWMAVIFALSSQSALPEPPGMSSLIASIIGHLAAYFILAGALVFALAPDLRLTVPRAIAVLVICVLYGISDEYHQSFVDGRTADPFDVVVDFIGALCGVAVSGLLLDRFAAWRNE